MTKPNIYEEFGRIVGIVASYDRKLFGAADAIENIRVITDRYRSEWDKYMRQEFPTPTNELDGQ